MDGLRAVSVAQCISDFLTASAALMTSPMMLRFAHSAWRALADLSAEHARLRKRLAPLLIWVDSLLTSCFKPPLVVLDPPQKRSNTIVHSSIARSRS